MISQFHCSAHMSDKKTDLMNTQRYWEERLTLNLNLRGTGHRAFGMDYNKWLYQAQTDCLDLLIAQHNIDVAGQRVLDVGSGSGFFVDYFAQRGAGTIYGVDITEVSVAHLRETYPQHTFLTCDIADTQPSIDHDFQLISVMSVLYHILDDTRFATAVTNLAHWLMPGGYLFISDTFAPSLLLTARHARFRTLHEYEQILLEHEIEIVDLIPVYYLLNRTFIPLLGPKLMDLLALGKWFYQFDQRMRNNGKNNRDGMKLLLARKKGQASAHSESWVR